MTKGDWSEDTKAIRLSKQTLIHMQRRGQIWVFLWTRTDLGGILIDPVITYQD